MAIIPRSTAQYYVRPDVAYVHVPDVAPSRVVLVWAEGRNRDDISEFAGIAQAAVTAPAPEENAPPPT